MLRRITFQLSSVIFWPGPDDKKKRCLIENQPSVLRKLASSDNSATAICSPWKCLGQNGCICFSLCVMIHFSGYPWLPDMKQIGTQAQCAAVKGESIQTEWTEIVLDFSLLKNSHPLSKKLHDQSCAQTRPKGDWEAFQRRRLLWAKDDFKIDATWPGL